MESLKVLLSSYNYLVIDTPKISFIFLGDSWHTVIMK